MVISWASRLVHFILSFQLVCNKKHEIWSLIGPTPIRFSLNEFAHITGLNCDYVANLMKPNVEVTEEMTDFWTLMGVSVESGPSYDTLVQACDYCENWEREDRLRLGYLSILDVFIDAKAHNSAIDLNLAKLVMDLEDFVEYPWGRVAFMLLMKSVKDTDTTKTYHINGFVQCLKAWVFYALPKFAEQNGLPNQVVQSPPLLAYGGIKGKRGFRTGMVSQTQINSFIRLDLKEMFPKWDDDDDDERVENIVKAMYGQFSSTPWKWLPNHWNPEGTLPSNNKPRLVKEEPGLGVKREVEDVDEGPHKKARLDYLYVEDLEKRLADALVVAVDARLQEFECIVKGQLEAHGKQLNHLSTQVEAISTVPKEASLWETKDNSNDKENDDKNMNAGIPPLKPMEHDTKLC